jgi:hypothetical protein
VADAIGIIEGLGSGIAAASGDGVVDSGSAAANQITGGVGDDSGIGVGSRKATAELGGLVEGRRATAGLGCRGADNDGAGGDWANEDVVLDDIGGNWAAKIDAWYEASGATALEGDVIGNQRLNGATAALLGCAIVASGSAAGLKFGDGVISGGSWSVGEDWATDLVVCHQSVTAASSLVVACLVGDGEDGVDATYFEGCVKGFSTTAGQGTVRVVFNNIE